MLLLAQHTAMKRLVTITAGLLGVWCLGGGAAAGQNRPATQWPSERVELIDGRQYRGLVESQDELWVHLIQIARPQGRPMHLVIRPIERRRVAAVVRLPTEEREKLRRQVERFLNRSRIEAGRIDAVRLGVVERHGTPYRSYRGRWFSLESSVDEATTRRVVVRLEQVFTAYRQILPPRTTSRRPLRLVVLGSMAEYREYLRKLEISIGNPACFIEDDNLVVAGSELKRFVAELAKTKAYHDRLRAELEALEKQMALRLKQVAAELDREGTPKEQIKKLLAAERAEFERDARKTREELGHIDRANARKFDLVTARMFERLYHEAFHAYLENYVYPHEQFDVPRWLNEGLAVMFEAGLLESETLRFDAPNRAVLERLKADLGGERPLRLEQVIRAERQVFLLPHDVRRGSGLTNRYYLYAWGLAYCMTFRNGLLDTAALDEYVRPSDNGSSPVERFEKLAGRSLDKFEPRWREYILKLR